MRPLLALAVAAAAAAGTGCSSLESFGLSAPAHKLIPPAQQIRESARAAEPLPRELNKGLLPSHVVEPKDVLLVQTVDLDAQVRIPADQPVQPDGTIDLGNYGRPVVAGKTAAQIEAELNKLLAAKEKEPTTVTVRVIARNSKVFYVLGEVNAPGAYPITGWETVLDGILAGGGLSRKASETSIILSRPTQPEGCRIVLPICYPQIVQLGDTATNYQLQPGDRIYVPSKGSFDGLNALCGRKPDCGPCGAPQVGCGPGGGVCPAPTPPVIGQ